MSSQLYQKLEKKTIHYVKSYTTKFVFQKCIKDNFFKQSWIIVNVYIYPSLFKLL